MTAAAMSFADVRDLAMSGEGDCCTDKTMLNHLMSTCLSQLWAMLPDEDRQQVKTFTTVIGQNEYDLGIGTTQLSSLAEGLCPLARRTPKCSPCCQQDEASCGCEITWTQNKSGKIVLFPTPKDVRTLTYCVIGDIDCTLSTTDAAGVVTWNNVPLPTKWQGVYADMVRAKSVMEADPIRGSLLMSMALESARVLKADRKELKRCFTLNIAEKDSCGDRDAGPCIVQPWQLGPSKKKITGRGSLASATYAP